jgi:general secretion pathway protein C
MVARLAAFVVWALVAATAVFWGLRLFVRAPAAPAYAVAVGDASAVRADLSRVLGSAPVAVASTVAAPEVSSRFKLLGIMAPKGPAAADSQSGVALIAVDGKPPKAFIVGSRLDDQLVLQSVSLRTASIGPAQGAASVRLELPALPSAATGTLPPVSNSNNPAPPFAPPTGQPVPQRPGVMPQIPGQGPMVSPAPMQAPPAPQSQGAAPMPGQVLAPNDPQQAMPGVIPPAARGDSNSPTK